MDIISSFSSPLKPELLGDNVRERIRAKVELWQFLDETIEDILSTYLEPEELATELINATIWKLHPSYPGPEIMEEAKLILKSLNIEEPKNYTDIFAKGFTSIVIKKIAGAIRRK